MSGRNKWRELARPIDEDPVRRARVERLRRAYDELLAAADDGLPDEELEELGNRLVRRARAEAPPREGRGTLPRVSPCGKRSERGP